MSLWDDYKYEYLFSDNYRDVSFGKVWHSKEGDIEVSKMSIPHIRNCMRLLDASSPWQRVFQDELLRRKDSRVQMQLIHKSIIEFTQQLSILEERGVELGGYKQILTDQLSTIMYDWMIHAFTPEQVKDYFDGYGGVRNGND